MTERFQFYENIYDEIYIEDLQGEDLRIGDEEDLNIENDVLPIINLLNNLHKEIQNLKEENQKLRELLFDPRRITNEVEHDD